MPTVICCRRRHRDCLEGPEQSRRCAVGGDEQSRRNHLDIVRRDRAGRRCALVNGRVYGGHVTSSRASLGWLTGRRLSIPASPRMPSPDSGICQVCPFWAQPSLSPAPRFAAGDMAATRTRCTTSGNLGPGRRKRPFLATYPTLRHRMAGASGRNISRLPNRRAA